ncbi:amino acid adenylation domain-containing protein [Bacillus cereus VD140]|nr:amino acid adenylation domain-containing protein [Bacillus cereus VD140]
MGTAKGMILVMDIKGFINDLKKSNIFLYQNQGKIKIIGPRELITAELKGKIKLYKEKIIIALKNEDIEKKNEIPKAKQSENNCYTLSMAQKRMLILNNLESKGTTYNIPLVIKIVGDFQMQVFENAFKVLIDRHEALRTSFVMIDGEPVQKIEKEIDFKIEYSELGEDSVSERVARFIRPFDLEIAPLLRVEILRVNQNEHIMMLDMHHIISDGVSMGILMKELADLVREKELAPLKVQYKDYSEWQKEYYKGDNIKQQEEYWLKVFEGDIPVLNMPTDFPRPQIQSSEGDRLGFEIDSELTKKLKFLARENGVTMYMLLLAVYKTLLSKYTRQEDIIVGSPIAGRTHDDLKNTIGMFVNTLAMRSYPKADTKFIDYLKQVKENTLNAYENQEYQFDTLVEKLNLRKETSRSALFDTMFDIQTQNNFEFNINGVTTEVCDIDFNVAKFDLSLTAIEYTDHLKFDLQYCTKLFKKETIKRLAGHLVNVIKEITNNPGLKLGEINLLSEEETEIILHKFNDTMAEFPKNKTLNHVFEEQVLKTPNHIAVIFEEEQLTYKQLNEKANRLARLLRKNGAKPDTVIGIMADKSPEMIIGILAILKAGAAYLPIDPEYPEERIEYMLKDSEAKLVVTQEHLQFKVRTVPSILFNDEEISSLNKDNLENLNHSSDLAYLIYTSGSSGKPKGVMTTHRNVINYIYAFSKQITLNEEDSILQVVSFSFDAFTEETFPILANSGKLIISKKIGDLNIDELVKNIEKYNVTLVSCSPLLLNEIDKNKHLILNKNMKFISGGDVLKYEYIKNIIEIADVYNSYGPTETTVCATYYKVSSNDCMGMSVPIGKPLSNYKLYVLDNNAQLLPIGIPGELYIGGEGVARGYKNKKELTEEKFKSNAFSLGERVYRTGDLVRWLPDGNIEFLGRIDNQVKIHGFRIELEEIEYHLLRQSNIKEAKVIDKEGIDGNRYLCAFITVNDLNEELNIDKVRELLAKELPGYMIPLHFIEMEKLPITLNGKVDVKALPEPDFNKFIENHYEAPRNLVEEKLALVWKDVLGIEKIGINHNFFEAGGHSLKAFSLVSKIHKELDVEIPLKQIFNFPTIKGIGEYIKGKETSTYSKIKKAEEKQFYNLSSAQKRLYILNQIEDSGITYNLPVVIQMKGRFQLDTFEKAFKALIDRHEALRTSFVMIDGEPVQKIEKEIDFKIEYSELGKENVAERVAQFIRPFNLEVAPLLRVEIVQVSQDVHIMMLDMHHIISDGVSMSILMKELTDIFGEKKLAPLEIQYKDYSEWKEKFCNGDSIKKQEEYWLKVFEDEIPVLNMPTDFPRPQIQSSEGDRLSFEIDSELTNKLKMFARENGVTMYMLLLAAYTTLLSKYTGQEDIIVGSPTAGRQHDDLKNTIGMFVNTLVMRNRPKADSRFIDYLKKVKENTLNAYENQDYQFDELVEKLALKRDISRNALFDTMFSIQNLDNLELNIKGLKIEPYDIDFKAAKFDLSLSAIENTNHIEFILEYCTKLFKKETIQRIGNHVVNILKEIVNNPEQKLSEINLLSQEEREIILNKFNDTAVEYPVGTIHELFEEQVKKTPNHIAVVFEEKQLTYEELNKKANKLARTLREKGVVQNSIVAIMVDRSVEMIVGILGVLKAGGAYLPIDPDYPTERIEFMLEDSNADIIITQEHLTDKNGSYGEVVNINHIDIYDIDEDNLNHINSPDDLVYIIYTSGTTGNPKGVLVEHKNLVNAHYTWRDHYELSKYEVNLLQMASMSFDVFAGDLCRSLLNGGTMYIVPSHIKLELDLLYKTIKKYKINIFESTPSLIIPFMNYVYENNFDLTTLRLLILGSDSCPIHEYKNLVKRYGENMRVINSYGVTEATIDSSYYEEEYDYIPQMVNTPIGKPLNNTKYYVLNSLLEPQPIGVYGELYIGGKGLAKGYLNKPDLTHERFVSNGFIPGEKMYKTGDLARWLSDGNIEFLGRIDNQVKVRGFRVEIGEIEAKLLGNQNINQAVVIDRKDNAGFTYLCAYIIAKEALTTSELRDYLSNYLPDYMIPSFFIQLDKMPLTPNGKIDRKALPLVQEGDLSKGTDYEAPRNEVEEHLVSAWQDVLGIKEIGINDSFFEVGGDSIKALQIVSKLSKVNLKLKIKDLFENPKIKNLSKYVKNESRVKNNYEIIQGNVPLMPIQKRHFVLNEALNNKELNHYNQSFMLYRKNGFEEQIVEKVFRKICEKHDVLRMIYKEENGEIIQYNRDLNGDFFDLYVHDIKNQDNQQEIVGQLATNIQKEISITDGKILKLGIFRTNEGDHLLITIHHLVIDGVSWRILFEDFEMLYKQAYLNEKLDIGFKTDSFKEFSEKLMDYAVGNKLLKEKKYWADISKMKVDFLAKNEEIDVTDYKNSKTLTISLNKENTQKLLGETNKTYNTQINDILLAALLVTVRDLTGENRLKILMEGHGREEVIENIDVSRTIGWFTTIYPVYFDLGKEKEISMSIKLVKETLRKIPNNGIGYGVLKYLKKDQDLLNDETAPILFNYLGEMSKKATNEEFSASWLSPGESIGGENARDASIEINSIIVEDTLIINTTFNEGEYSEILIADFNQKYKENLEMIIDHCINQTESEKTASDYGYNKMSLEELDELLGEYEFIDN